MSDIERIEDCETIELEGGAQLPEPYNCLFEWIPRDPDAILEVRYNGELPNRWYRFWSRVLLNAHWTEIEGDDS